MIPDFCHSYSLSVTVFITHTGMNVAVSFQVFLHLEMYEDCLEEVQSCNFWALTFPHEAQTLGHRGTARSIHKLK